VESIDPTPAADRTTEYLVPAWVRVRREDFGLLFYDTRSTRLTYVRSGESLTPPPFVSAWRTLAIEAGEKQLSVALLKLLDDLVAKGLLVACPAK
jgi:putative mycofactocin binding protein MftB